MGVDARLTPGERENLVAYLDGELTENERRAIEAVRAQSAVARREIEALERTWELLELLPKPEVPEDFATRTLTQAAGLEVQTVRLEIAAVRYGRRLLRIAVWFLVCACGLAAGYVATRVAWPDRTARLTRDLSIAEHFEEYLDVGSFEFLEMLDRDPVFVNDE